jgi:hypothetical protein
MNYTLHKLPQGFIITSNESYTNGDFVLLPISFEIVRCVNGTTFIEETKKVIAQQDQIDFSALSEEEQKEIGWYDVEKLISKDTQQLSFEGKSIVEINAYKNGAYNYFQKAQELLSNRRFTLEHMEAAACFGKILERFKDDEYKLSDNDEWKGFLRSLQSWSVELERGILKHTQNCISKDEKEFVYEPRLINGKVKVLKLLI